MRLGMLASVSVPLLQKPFSPASSAERVRSLLEGLGTHAADGANGDGRLPAAG